MKLKHRYLLVMMQIWAAISLWAQRRHFAAMASIVAEAKFELEDLKTSHFDLKAESITIDDETPIH